MVVAALLLILFLGTVHITKFTLLFFAALIPSIILHEVTHGWVALAFGDDTAKRAGRLTLNPLKHIDPLGTIVVPAVLILTTGWAFGWAKPVPVNISRLRNPRNDNVIVALAGPITNIALALAAGLAYGFFVPFATKNIPVPSQPTGPQFLFLIGYVNVILAVFNLIPIPPLDGSAVLERLMPRSWIPAYLRIRPYTIFIVLGFVLLSRDGLQSVFDPFLNLWSRLLV